MKHADFYIGIEFISTTGQFWRCTDVGHRTICAINIESGRYPSWYVGPPYAVAEVVFDEHDFSGCYRNEKEATESAILQNETSGHPGYPYEDVLRMVDEMDRCVSETEYRNPGLLRFDRIASRDVLLHPYAAKQSEDGWVIRLYSPFSQQFIDMPEMDFLALPIATDADVKRMAENHTYEVD